MFSLTQVGAIIIAPTRTLASQIYEVLETFTKHLPQLTYMQLIGGEDAAETIANYLKNGWELVLKTLFYFLKQ